MHNPIADVVNISADSGLLETWYFPKPNPTLGIVRFRTCSDSLGDLMIIDHSRS